MTDEENLAANERLMRTVRVYGERAARREMALLMMGTLGWILAVLGWMR